MRKNIFLCLILVVATASCTRKAKGPGSLLRIQAPTGQGKVGSMAAAPAGLKKCYAVNVTGTGIAPTARSCGSSLGAFAGFVEAGGTLELNVPVGTGRTVDLYLYLAPDSSVGCPQLTAACTATLSCNTYKVATATGVDTSQTETTVEMTVDFLGLSNNAVAQEAPASALCSASVSAAFTIDGKIVDSNLNAIAGAPFTPAAATFFKRVSATSFQVITRSLATSEGLSLPSVRPQVRSLASKPGTDLVYGMLSDGSLALISVSGEYTLLTAANCPFVSCTVPRWFKSFSLSSGPEVYGLDHGGGLWKLDAAGTPSLVTTLPPYVQQVSMQ